MLPGAEREAAKLPAALTAALASGTATAAEASAGSSECPANHALQ